MEKKNHTPSPPSRPNALRMEQLSIGYTGRHGAATVVASALNGTLSCGEMTCLVGPNGVGKSTLLRTIAGLQRPLAGQVSIGGIDIGTMSRQQKALAVAVVLTDTALTTSMTAAEVVALGRSPYTNFWGTLTDNDRHIIREAMEQVGIPSLAQRPIQALSDGERQKVMIAKALAQQTPVLLLDEPTAFLDFNSRIDILLLLRRLAHEQQKAVLLSTHDLQLCLWTADQLWCLDQQATLTTGTPDYLATAGVIGQMIAADGVSFDPIAMQINLNKT